MKVKKILFAVWLLVVCITTHGCTTDDANLPTAKNGVIDLRNRKFVTQIPLDGKWYFYWNRLISPNETVNKKEGILVDFPFKWNGYKINGKELPDFGYATYQLTVLIDKSTPQLRIAMPDVYCAYSLFINGEELATNGTVATNAKDFEAHWQFHTVAVPMNTDTVKITLQIANFAHSKSGISKQIFIAYRDVIEQKRLSAECVDLLLTGCLLMGGLFFLGLFLLGSRDKAILLFSLFCIVYSYRIVGTDNYVLHTIFPNINWYITTRVEYVSLFFGIGLFGLYTRYLYPRDINKLMIYGIGSVCFAFAAASMITPPVFFTRLVNPFLIVMLFCLMYIPYVFYNAYRKKGRDHYMPYLVLYR